MSGNKNTLVLQNWEPEKNISGTVSTENVYQIDNNWGWAYEFQNFNKKRPPFIEWPLGRRSSVFKLKKNKKQIALCLCLYIPEIKIANKFAK